MEGTGTHLHVIGLENDTTLFGPIALQSEDKALKGRYIVVFLIRSSVHVRISIESRWKARIITGHPGHG
jgi:hypothetical protein